MIYKTMAMAIRGLDMSIHDKQIVAERMASATRTLTSAFQPELDFDRKEFIESCVGAPHEVRRQAELELYKRVLEGLEATVDAPDSFG